MFDILCTLQVRLMLLAALAGEHLLLLGPPGTAKSELSRRLSKQTGGKYFERLLTRFSVPEVPSPPPDTPAFSGSTLPLAECNRSNKHLLSMCLTCSASRSGRREG